MIRRSLQSSRRLLASAALTALAAAMPASALASVCSSIGSTVVLVDRTVADRDALANETRATFDQMLEEVWSKGEAYFDSKVALVFLDDQGEHSASWQIRLPKHYGMQKSDMKNGMALLASKVMTSLNEIRADKKQYASSMILEGVSKQLNQLGPCDRLVVISDLCVVDKSGNNFERLVFNDPRRLPRRAQVELRRLGRPRQTLEAIELIEAWWRDTLYGDGQFKKAYAELKAHNPMTSLEPESKPLQTAGTAKPRPALQSSEAPPALARTNEARITADIKKLKSCLDPTQASKSEAGSYRFKIYVEASGQPAKVEPVEGVSRKIKECLSKALMEYKYALHPQQDSYFFVQPIEVGNFSG